MIGGAGAVQGGAYVHMPLALDQRVLWRRDDNVVEKINKRLHMYAEVRIYG
jgi:hypothetical protein